MFFVIFICIFIQERNAISTVRFSIIVAENTTQNIELYYDNDKYYAFLPSYAETNNISVKYCAGCSLFLDEQYYNSDSSFSDIIMNKEYSLVIKNIFGIPVYQSHLIIMKGENIPSLSITLFNGSIDEVNANKDVSKSGYAKIVNSDKKVDFTGNFKELHGRGNTTWLQAKKSYALEFPQEVDLLNMGSAKGWVLLSNSFDESGLRNKLTYDVAKEIGVNYAVDSEYVDLYINNVYYGLYLLTERIEVGENRVNIKNLSELTRELNNSQLSSYPQFEVTDNNRIKRGYSIPNNPEDITGGYLLQIEHYSGIDVQKSLIQTNELSFSVSSPKYASKEQIDYLFEYLNNIEDKIKRNDLSCIDLESFIKLYLIQELFANYDNGSFYFYKDTDKLDNKLYACSIWDFDLSMGNSWLIPDTNPRFLYQISDNWFNYIYNNEDFYNRLKQYYKDRIHPDIISQINQRLIQYKSLISQSFKMDKVRWKYKSNSDTWADKSQNRFDSLDEHVDYIADYMKQRIEFLDNLWIDNEHYCFLSFSSSENKEFRKQFSVKYGELFNEYPNPESEETKSSKFLGWFDSQGNQFFPNQIITSNNNYIAKWEQNNDTTNALVSTQDEPPLSFVERIRLRLSGENKYLTIGLGIVVLAIIVFVSDDIRRKIKTRRYHNETKH